MNTSWPIGLHATCLPESTGALEWLINTALATHARVHVVSYEVGKEILAQMFQDKGGADVLHTPGGEYRLPCISVGEPDSLDLLFAFDGTEPQPSPGPASEVCDLLLIHMAALGPRSPKELADLAEKHGIPIVGTWQTTREGKMPPGIFPHAKSYNALPTITVH